MFLMKCWTEKYLLIFFSNSGGTGCAASLQADVAELQLALLWHTHWQAVVTSGFLLSPEFLSDWLLSSTQLPPWSGFAVIAQWNTDILKYQWHGLSLYVGLESNPWQCEWKTILWIIITKVRLSVWAFSSMSAHQSSSILFVDTFVVLAFDHSQSGLTNLCPLPGQSRAEQG